MPNSPPGEFLSEDNTSSAITPTNLRPSTAWTRRTLTLWFSGNRPKEPTDPTDPLTTVPAPIYGDLSVECE